MGFRISMSTVAISTLQKDTYESMGVFLRLPKVAHLHGAL